MFIELTEEDIVSQYINLSKYMNRQVWLVPLADYNNEVLLSAAADAFLYGDESFVLDENPLIIPVRNFNSLGVINKGNGKMIIKNLRAFKKELKIK